VRPLRLFPLLAPLMFPTVLLFLFLFLGLAPAAARAQSGGDVTIRQFQPTPFSDGMLRLDGTQTLSPWKLRAAVDADYAWKPLVLTDLAPSLQRSRKTTYDLIGHGVGADLTLALGLGRRFEIGAILPFTVFQTGETVAGTASPGTAGLANAKVGAKAHLLGKGPGFGLGASLLIAIPFGVGGPYIHETSPGGEARLFGDYRTDRLRVGASAGYRLRGDLQLFDIPLGDELVYAAGAEARLSAKTQLFAELAGAARAADPFGSTRQSPLELLVGGRRLVGGGGLGGDNRFWLTGAAGPGLVAGYGSPVVRAVLGLAWSNEPVPRPPAPPPPPAPPVEKCPGGAGCPKKEEPPPDRDKDGILDDADECPDEPEDKDGFEDEDGCPDPDNDKDGILDAADKCPNEPETINGKDDEDGCPDKGDAAVRIGKEELETLKPIFFETDHSRVRHAFFNILGQVASTLKAHPEIGRCAVEGHTDDTGPPEWNQKLSVLRADAVVEFLVAKGVDRKRLAAIGHGEKAPWAPNDTESGRAKNRRVLFHIEGVNQEDEQKQERRKRVRARNAAKKTEAAAPPRTNETPSPPRSRSERPATAPPVGKTIPESKSDGQEPKETKETKEPKDSKPGKPEQPAKKSDKPATLRDLLKLPPNP
jgi:outer membrane protein OmpA-like peptidoglycan-associated protein